MPVRIAQARARQRWPSARAASPVIHCDSPDASAVRPSRLAAAFIRTQGRPRVIRDTKPMLSSRASSARRPTSTAMPAARNRAAPSAASGLGSAIAATTRADAGGEHGIGARRRAAGVVARLERHVERGAARVVSARPRIRQRVDLGVRLARALVPAFADHRAVLDDHAADPRIRRRRVEAALGQHERARHVRAVGVGERGHRETRRDSNRAASARPVPENASSHRVRVAAVTSARACPAPRLP